MRMLRVAGLAALLPALLLGCGRTELEGELPDASVADVPDGALPDGALPDGALPDGDLPDGALPDGDFPDVPGTDGDLPDDGPDLDVPDDGPDFDVPDDGPDLDVPDVTDVPVDLPDIPNVCPPELTRCGDSCVDPLSDPNNCGGCGASFRCDAGLGCTSSAC